MYKVIETFKGSPDGSAVIEYKEGEVVDLEANLAKVALDEGWVELVDAPDQPDQTEEEPGNEDDTSLDADNIGDDIDPLINPPVDPDNDSAA